MPAGIPKHGHSLHLLQSRPSAGDTLVLLSWPGGSGRDMNANGLTP